MKSRPWSLRWHLAWQPGGSWVVDAAGNTALDGGPHHKDEVRRVGTR